MIRLTRAQVRQIDRLSVERYKIPGVVLMENAAGAAADVACEMLPPNRGDVLIVCGGGNNGGDGLAIARHLHNRGYDVKIALTADPAKYQNEALANWKIVQAMALPTAPFDANARPALILDGIFGTGLSQAPRDPFNEIAQSIAAMNAPVLAIDIPSGLDCDTGKPLGPCIRATRTITFVAEKAGFAEPAAAEYLGIVTVGDIGCPVELIRQVLTAPPASHPHN
ncbi:MAG TPA: NAD(P)H-hydrate epimerase [Tepidisphaeraceae bacterium]|nr:NAD(P)H-hydrate epimerase [Tepidisphaeraceae bacterium]